MAKKVRTRWQHRRAASTDRRIQRVSAAFGRMHYTHDLGNGQQLHLGNDAGHTSVTLATDGPGQQQSQATGFNTGEWTEPPTLSRAGGDFLVRLTTKQGIQILRIRGNQVQRLEHETGAVAGEELPLSGTGGVPPTAPMKPMTPMTPMKPMEPMRPMSSMRPMRMQMGDMQMSMGEKAEAEPRKRFCTQCGAALGEQDRFCGSCGHEA